MLVRLFLFLTDRLSLSLFIPSLSQLSKQTRLKPLLYHENKRKGEANSAAFKALSGLDSAISKSRQASRLNGNVSLDATLNAIELFVSLYTRVL